MNRENGYLKQFDRTIDLGDRGNEILFFKKLGVNLIKSLSSPSKQTAFLTNLNRQSDEESDSTKQSNSKTLDR